MSAKKYSPAGQSKAAPAKPTVRIAPAPVAVEEKPSSAVPDSPRQRVIAKVVLLALWIYVAALWLLALDQWFNWGIFGPKTPVGP